MFFDGISIKQGSGKLTRYVLNKIMLLIFNIFFIILCLLCSTSGKEDEWQTISKQNAPSTCNPDCQLEITSAREYATTLNTETTTKYDQLLADLESNLVANLTAVNQRITTEVNSLIEEQNKALARIVVLEEQVSVGQAALAKRIDEVDANILNNATTLQDQFGLDLNKLQKDILNIVNNTQADLNKRIDQVALMANSSQSGNNGGVSETTTTTTPKPSPVGSVDQLFQNLTQRIDSLEFGKVKNLSDDSTMWRRNFRVVNNTFERMKKNNCMC